MIRQMGARESVVVFCFDIDAVATAKKLDPGIPVCFLNSAISEKDIQKIAEIGGDYAGSGSGGSAEIIGYAHQQKVKYWRWTVNSVDEMQKQIAGGVDGIITNYPQVLVKLR